MSDTNTLLTASSSQLKEVIELNQNYQAALSMDLLTFENRLKQYSTLIGFINKSMISLMKRKKTHLNTSFVVEHVPFQEEGKVFLIEKKCPRYFSILKKMRVTVKQIYQSSNKKKIGMQPDLSENKYKFTEEEDEVLTKQIIQDNGNHDWIEIARQVGRTPIECVRRHLELKKMIKKQKWTPEENETLKDAVKTHGINNWLQISNYFEGKTSTQCFNHWMKKSDPNITRGKWSYADDLKLAKAYSLYGAGTKKQWNKIAGHIKGRTDIQCRERYCNILDPALKNTQWTEEEDQKLLSLVKMIGSKWAKIAKKIGNRTDNHCLRRWKQLIKLNNKRQTKAMYKSEKQIFKVIRESKN